MRRSLIPILFGSPQPVVSLNFAASQFAIGGQRSSSFLSVPGAAYTGSVSGTGATVRTAVDSAGNLISFANNVPRVTDLGILIEEGRTNSFLNSAVGVSQSVTTTAVAWTLSFYGTGSITSTGSGAYNLTGSGANVRVSQTLTPSAAPCVLVVSGSCTNVQLEAGAFASSYIPTVGSPVVRTADVATVAGVKVPAVGYLLVSVGQMETNANPVSVVAATINDGSNTNRAITNIPATTANAAFGVTVAGSATNPSTLTSAYTLAGGKAAIAWPSVTGAAGGVVTSSTLGGAPLLATTLYVGQSFGAGTQISGYIKRVVVGSGSPGLAGLTR